MRHDILSDVFSSIKNSEDIGKKECIVASSGMIKEVLGILQKHKYIGKFGLVDDTRGGMLKVELLGRINNCNAIRPRFSVGVIDMTKFEKRYLPANDVGILVISTSQGIMSQKAAKEKGIGGKLLGFVY